MKLLFLLAVLAVLSQWVPLAQGAVYLDAVNVDPPGIDTGQEWIRLINTGTGSTALEGWILSATNIPDIHFGSDHHILPQSTLTIHYRSDGVSDSEHLHVDESFSQSNISNTSGYIGLFAGNNKTTAPLLDYILYGKENGTFSSKANQQGIWDPQWFLTIPEGFIAQRSDYVLQPHHSDAWTVVPLPVTVPPEEPLTTGSGTTLPTNTPPVPIITVQGNGSAEGIAPFSFNVTGQESHDPDGDAISYWWEFGNGESTDRSNPLATTYDDPGTYTVTLTVTDVHGISSTTFVVVTVHAKTTTPPYSSPPATQNCTPNTTNTNLILSEIMPNPDGPDTDNEWIELYNNSDQPLELCGWIVDDEEGGSTPYTLPAFLLGPRAYFVIESAVSKIALNNTYDEARLFSPLQVLVDSVSFTNPPSGKSYARIIP